MLSKSAIVTGGTRGIGLGISQQLASDGYDLILGFNTNEEAASIAKNNIESTYGQAKAVVEFLTRYYAKILAPRRITINVVIPGFTKTEAWNSVTAKYGGVESETMQKMIENTPMQRWASPTEIGQVVAFLCSPKAAFITGVALPVDGGLHLC